MTNQTYTFYEAADMIGLHHEAMYQWYGKGLLQPYMDNPTLHRLTKLDLKRIDHQLTPPAGSVSKRELMAQFHISNTLFGNLKKKYHLPLVKHRPDQLSPRHAYFTKETVLKFGQALADHRSKRSRLPDLKPNTAHLYDPKVDVTPAQLRRQLKPEPRVQYYFEWIAAHKIDGLYSVDKYFKIFFTADQVTKIKAKYCHLKPDTYGTTDKLCQQLKLTKSNFNALCDRCGIHGYHVLGYRETFYLNPDVQILIGHQKGTPHDRSISH